MPDTKTIGEVCAEFDVTPRALRFYEAKGLLSPIREGQKRLFTNRCRARLKLILQGKRFGFSLNEIKDLLDLYHLGDGQVTQLSATLEAAGRHHAELVAQRDELGRGDRRARAADGPDAAGCSRRRAPAAPPNSRFHDLASRHPGPPMPHYEPPLRDYRFVLHEALKIHERDRDPRL